MKVLTIKQPWALLLKKGIKTMETRSFKTNYRGELYIHAGKSKIKDKEIRNPQILKDVVEEECCYGAIILKCKLVDCIYMDDKFINKTKKNPKEYATGRYEVGRYACLLEDIESIEPIYVNGQLGIWNYKNN